MSGYQEVLGENAEVSTCSLDSIPLFSGIPVEALVERMLSRGPALVGED